MEDIDARKRGRRLHALDGKPGAWCPGIARGGEHDADGSLAPPAQGGGQPAPGSHGLEHGKDVLVEAGQDGLTLGIAEATIELHDARAVGTDHEPDEEHARVRRAFLRHGGQRGRDDLLHDPARHGLVHDGSGRVRAHAARVGPAIIVEDRLVVLGREQGEDGSTVGDHEEAGEFEVIV